MYWADCLPFLRVRCPSVGPPHGVPGWRPGVVEPSPPPCGWSTGFIAVPRVCGRTPMWRFLPALPTFTFWCSALPSTPTVAGGGAPRAVLLSPPLSPVLLLGGWALPAHADGRAALHAHHPHLTRG